MPDVSPEYPSPTSARAFKEALDGYENIKNINLYINSPGGYMDEGNAIYSMLKRHPANIHVYIDGMAASMASAIAMAGDTITMSPISTMMIHNPWTIAYGNAAELKKVAKDLETMGEAFNQAYLLKAGGKLNKETLQALLDNETFLTPEQCLEYGLCDEIEFKEEPKTIQLNVDTDGFEAKLKEYCNKYVDERLQILGYGEVKTKTVDQLEDELAGFFNE